MLSSNLSKQDILDLSALLNQVAPHPRMADVSGIPVIALTEGESWQSLGRLLPAPKRHSGFITTNTVESFAALVNELEQATARIYYTRDGGIDAILNDDVRTAPNWRDYRICYRPAPSASWAAWCATFPDAKETRWLDQLSMAEFIEERIGDFLFPTGAEMLELAQRFEVARAGTFASGVRLSSGATELTVTDTHEGRSTIAIPAQVTLGMRVFEGMGAYQFKAAFRYRIRDGKLALTFRILHSANLLETAVDDLLTAARESLTNGGERIFVRVVSMPDAVR